MNSEPTKNGFHEAVPIVHLRPAPIPADVAERIPQVFPNSTGAVAHKLGQLRSEDSRLYSDRIIRCIVYCAAQYPATTMDDWIKQAHTDPPRPYRCSGV